MKIELISEKHEAACEEFLSHQEGGLFYYSKRYRAFLRMLLGCMEETLIARDGDQIVGMLPLMRTTGSYGDVLNSLPFYGSNGGIMCSNSEAFDELLAAYNEMVKDQNLVSSTIISNPFQPFDYTKAQHCFNDHRIGQFTPLVNAEDSSGELLNAFESSTRRNIRKAKKNGVEITIEKESIGFLESVHLDNMAAIGGKAKPSSFFRLVERYFRWNKDYSIYLASMEGEPVAALLVFYYNGVVEYYTPAIVEAFRTFQPLSLIIYTAMVDASKQGYKLWNWGGTWPDQDGVYRFKKKWGSFEKPYKYYIQINNESIRSASRERLIKEYDGFYVIPFSHLSSDGNR